MSLFAFRRYDLALCYSPFAFPTGPVSDASPFATLMSLPCPHFLNKSSISTLRGLCLACVASCLAFGWSLWGIRKTVRTEQGCSVSPVAWARLCPPRLKRFGELWMDKADELDWLIWFLLGWIDGLMMMLTKDDDGPAGRLV